MSALKPGTSAPVFRLPSTPDQCVSLSDLRGKPVVLVFYPADWNPVCSDQLALYGELVPRQLAKWRGAHVIATASSRNLDFVRSFGADEVVDYQAFDAVVGQTLDRSWSMLRPGGRLVTRAKRGGTLPRR
jgi:hypothetical protein